MPTPPAANRRWNSISSGVTTRFGVRPSNVAALIDAVAQRDGPERGRDERVGHEPYQFLPRYAGRSTQIVPEIDTG